MCTSEWLASRRNEECVIIDPSKSRGSRSCWGCPPLIRRRRTCIRPPPLLSPPTARVLSMDRPFGGQFTDLVRRCREVDSSHESGSGRQWGPSMIRPAGPRLYPSMFLDRVRVWKRLEWTMTCVRRKFDFSPHRSRGHREMFRRHFAPQPILSWQY